MSDAAPTPRRITAGPRFDALLDALEVAREALAEPFTDDELDAGWNDELRDEMRTALGDNLDGLRTEPTRSDLLVGMVDGDEIDPGDDERRDATFLPEAAAASLLYAEQVLLAATALLELLNRPLTENDRAHGMTDATSLEFRELLGGVVSTLADGAYVTGDQSERWMRLLEENGFERRVPDRPHLGAGLDVIAGQIDRFPTGRCWQPICIFDPAFLRLAVMDDDTVED